MSIYPMRKVYPTVGPLAGYCVKIGASRNRDAQGRGPLTGCRWSNCLFAHPPSAAAIAFISCHVFAVKYNNPLERRKKTNYAFMPKAKLH